MDTCLWCTPCVQGVQENWSEREMSSGARAIRTCKLGLYFTSSLVSVSHLFGAQLARRVQEICWFLGDGFSGNMLVRQSAEVAYFHVFLREWDLGSRGRSGILPAQCLARHWTHVLRQVLVLSDEGVLGS